MGSSLPFHIAHSYEVAAQYQLFILATRLEKLEPENLWHFCVFCVQLLEGTQQVKSDCVKSSASLILDQNPASLVDTLVCHQSPCFCESYGTDFSEVAP